MHEPGAAADSGAGVADEPAVAAAQLAQELRARARASATATLRQGLEEIEAQHGMPVADEVAGLIDVAEVFEGLLDKSTGGNDSDSFEFRSYT